MASCFFSRILIYYRVMIPHNMVSWVTSPIKQNEKRKINSGKRSSFSYPFQEWSLHQTLKPFFVFTLPAFLMPLQFLLNNFHYFIEVFSLLSLWDLGVWPKDSTYSELWRTFWTSVIRWPLPSTVLCCSLLGSFQSFTLKTATEMFTCSEHARAKIPWY